MRLIPSDAHASPLQSDVSSYTVSVALNLNPMLPLCYTTEVSVEDEPDGSLTPLARFECVDCYCHYQCIY